MNTRYARQYAYKKAMRARWRAAGACIRCGVPCPRNPATGKPYALCLPHRQQESVRQQRNYPNRARTKARQANFVNGKWVSLIRTHPISVAHRFAVVL